MTVQPVIDVLVPVFNGAKTIRSALESMLNQTIRELRVVVVDDGSTDDTPTILADMAAQDSRLVILSKKNGGIVDALNHGLRACSSPYVARHDADDLASPERLATQLRFLESHPDHVGVSANAWHIDEFGRPIGSRTHYDGEPAQDPRAIPSVEPYLMHPFLLVRRDALVAVGGYRYCIHSEDTDLYWRLLSLGRLHSLPEILGEYRIHGASLSSASVLNGRVAAVSSQLAALSFRRRAAGVPDIDFPADARARYEAARSFEAIVALAGEPLDAQERTYLELAAAVKFLSLLTYRPYQPDRDDLAYVTSMIARHRGLLNAGDAASTEEYRGRAAMQLLLHGDFAKATMLRPSLKPLLTTVYRQIKRWVYHSRNRLARRG